MDPWRGLSYSPWLPSQGALVTSPHSHWGTLSPDLCAVPRKEPKQPLLPLWVIAQAFRMRPLNFSPWGSAAGENRYSSGIHLTKKGNPSRIFVIVGWPAISLGLQVTLLFSMTWPIMADAGALLGSAVDSGYRASSVCGTSLPSLSPSQNLSDFLSLSCSPANPGPSSPTQALLLQVEPLGNMGYVTEGCISTEEPGGGSP